MIKITKVAIRNNNSIPWNKELTYDILTVINEYIYNQKLLGRTQILDNNTNTTISVWATQDDYDTYLNDPRLVNWFAALDAHRAMHSITITVDTVNSISLQDPDYQQYVGHFIIMDGTGAPIPVETFMN